METQETPEQAKIRELETKVYNQEQEIWQLQIANARLGYSTMLMSEFHLTGDDKDSVANSFDLANNPDEAKQVYEEYRKVLFNKTLDGTDFQMSEDFKDMSRHFFAVSLGFDPIGKISEHIETISAYFSFENDIRNTPDAGQRQAKTDVLLKKRPGATEALNEIIDLLNELNDKERAKVQES